MNGLTARPRWFNIAITEYGEREIPGREHNKRILAYHRATELRATEDEINWCSAYVCFCFETSSIRSTRQAVARSWYWWGIQLENPRIGCVVIFWRGDPESWQGHVGFYCGETETHIMVLGGNQNDEVNVSLFPKTQLLGYRWPKGE